MARPIRTVYSNLILTASEQAVGDLHATRGEDGSIQSVWLLEPAEREAIAAGANVVLSVYSDHHPAVSIAVAHVQEAEGELTQQALERAARLAAMSGEHVEPDPPHAE